MKKTLYITIICLSLFWVTLLFNGQNSTPKAKAATDTEYVTLSVNITDSIDLVTTTGSTINFGNLSPGTPKCDAAGSSFTVTTNASNGYHITVTDGSDTNSPMVNTGSYVPDITGTTATPIAWTTGTVQGLGLTLYSGTQKEAAWGTGTTACDQFNKWAKVPNAAATGHAVTGYRAAADPSYWGWKIDAPAGQKTGAYTGAVTFTATTIL